MTHTTTERVVAFVPLKLQSRRVPGKNLRALGGKPLFIWILDSLSRAKHIDQIYIFASEDWFAESPTYSGEREVKQLERPRSLDSDDVTGEQIYQSFAAHVPSDYYLLAHATSPFLSPKTIDACVEAVFSEGFDSALTVKRHQTFVRDASGRPINFSLDRMLPTQRLSPVFSDTSGLYLFSAETLQSGKRTGRNPYMKEVCFAEALDIDNEEDFLMAELYLRADLSAASGLHAISD